MHNFPVIGTFLAAFCLTAQAMAAQPSPQGPWAPPQGLIKADAALETSIEHAEKAGSDLPRLADPRSRALLLSAFDEREVSQMNGADPPAFFIQDNFTNICSVPLGLAAVYASHGVKHLTPADLNSSRTNPVRQKIAHNLIAYQDERTLAYGFAVTCFGVEISALKTSIEAMAPTMRGPGVMQAPQLMTQPVPRLYLAVLQAQGDTSLSLGNRTHLLDRAAQYAYAYAARLAPSDRKAAISQVDAVLPSAPSPNRAKLLHIREALSKPCTGLLCAQDSPPSKAAGHAH